jgi:arginyl-tRNA synthetase
LAGELGVALPELCEQEARPESEERIETVILAYRIIQLQETILASVNSRSPHLLGTYVFRLAQTFVAFHDRRRIFGVDNQEMRLKLVRATKLGMETAMDLLGFRAHRILKRYYEQQQG